MYYDKKVNFISRDLKVDEEFTGKLLYTQVHGRLLDHLSQATAEFIDQRHKKGQLATQKERTQTGDISKLSPRLWGLYWVLKHLSGHEYKGRHEGTGETHEEHGGFLKLFPDVEVAEADKDDGNLDPYSVFS